MRSLLAASAVTHQRYGGRENGSFLASMNACSSVRWSSPARRRLKSCAGSIPDGLARTSMQSGGRARWSFSPVRDARCSESRTTSPISSSTRIGTISRVFDHRSSRLLAPCRPISQVARPVTEAAGGEPTVRNETAGTLRGFDSRRLAHSPTTRRVRLRQGARSRRSSRRARGHAARARLSWHSLRHAFASALATDLEVPSTTLARIIGHADAGFTLKLYARDARNDATIAADMLARAKRAGIPR